MILVVQLSHVLAFFFFDVFFAAFHGVGVCYHGDYCDHLLTIMEGWGWCMKRLEEHIRVFYTTEIISCIVIRAALEA